MADLNIRNIDVTLVTQLKVDAARHGMTLREWCVRLLGAVSDDKERGVNSPGPQHVDAVPALPLPRPSGRPAHAPICKCLSCNPGT